jgi:hypothetical protein
MAAQRALQFDEDEQAHRSRLALQGVTEASS